VKEGNWLREHRGIYRLRQYPRSENGQLVLLSLWSRNRHCQPQGVYSHTTALSLRDLSDANPSKLHMTVPPGFRRNSEVPAVLELHKSRLEPHEVIRQRGYAITTAMRAILDAAGSGDADGDMLEQALGEGLRRGLITRTEIKQAKARVDVAPGAEANSGEILTDEMPCWSRLPGFGNRSSQSLRPSAGSTVTSMRSSTRWPVIAAGFLDEQMAAIGSACARATARAAHVA